MPEVPFFKPGKLLCVISAQGEGCARFFARRITRLLHKRSRELQLGVGELGMSIFDRGIRVSQAVVSEEFELFYGPRAIYRLVRLSNDF
jgi:hypothetical protein